MEILEDFLCNLGMTFFGAYICVHSSRQSSCITITFKIKSHWLPAAVPALAVRFAISLQRRAPLFFVLILTFSKQKRQPQGRRPIAFSQNSWMLPQRKK